MQMLAVWLRKRTHLAEQTCRSSSRCRLPGVRRHAWGLSAPGELLYMIGEHLQYSDQTGIMRMNGGCAGIEGTVLHTAGGGHLKFADRPC